MEVSQEIRAPGGRDGMKGGGPDDQVEGIGDADHVGCILRLPTALDEDGRQDAAFFHQRREIEDLAEAFALGVQRLVDDVRFRSEPALRTKGFRFLCQGLALQVQGGCCVRGQHGGRTQVFQLR